MDNIFELFIDIAVLYNIRENGSAGRKKCLIWECD